MPRIRVGINGFGRIGRVTARQILSQELLELVAVSDIVADAANLAYLYNHDSNYGRPSQPAFVTDNGAGLDFGSGSVRLFCDAKMANVPWVECGVDVLIDASGVESNIEEARVVLEKHGAQNIIITHSPRLAVDKTIILGVNDHELDPALHKIVSSSICDTNAIAHILKSLDTEYGIEAGFVTTLHPWLSYQNLVDGPVAAQSDRKHAWTDYSLGRATPSALIPKNTTAISALKYVLPDLAAKLKGFSYRTPTAVVSSADMTISIRRDVDVDSIKRHLFEYFGDSRYVSLNTESLVSKDYEGTTASVIVDLQWIMVSGKRLVKLVGWYDNEWGYCARLVELAARLGSAGTCEQRPAAITSSGFVPDLQNESAL